METVSLSVPQIKFDEPETRHVVEIPDGHCAVVLAEGERMARVSLEPGNHETIN